MTAGKSNKNGSKKVPRRQAPPRKPRSSAKEKLTVTPQHAQVLKCVREQLDAVFDPFNCSGQPCNFGVGADPNFSVRQSYRGVITFSAGSAGLLLVNPSCANDNISAWYSDGTKATVVSTIKLGTQIEMTGSPFGSASFGAGLLVQRCVGGAVRVKNVSASLYKQGMIESYMHYDEGYFALADTFNTFDANKRKLYGRDSLTQPWIKFDATDSDNFNANSHYHGNTHGDMIFYIPPTASGAAQIFVDMVFFYEVRGPRVQGLVRQVPSEPGVYSAVRGVMENIIVSLNGEVPSAKSLVNRALKYLEGTLTSELVTAASKEVQTAARDVLNGYWKEVAF